MTTVIAFPQAPSLRSVTCTVNCYNY